MFFEHSDVKIRVIPNYPAKEIDRGLFNETVKHDLQIIREEFLRVVK